VNIELTEIATLAGIAVTVGSIAMGSYIGVVKANVSVKKDINSAFDSLRSIEDKFTRTELRIDNKAKRIEDMEKMLFEYIKRHEAEELFVKKDILNPVIENIQKNQETLHCEVKEFRDDILNSLNNITSNFNTQMTRNLEFQQELLVAIKQEGCRNK